MYLTIEQRIFSPLLQRTRNGKWKTMFSKMEVGESFLVSELKQAISACNCARRFGYEVTMRKVLGGYRIFKTWTEHIGLGPEFTPHSARATAITYLAERGIPHRAIAAFSRHKSVRMVEEYDKLRGKSGSAAVEALDFSSKRKKDLPNKYDLD